MGDQTRCVPLSRTGNSPLWPQTVLAAKAVIMLHGRRVAPADAGLGDGAGELRIRVKSITSRSEAMRGW